MYLFDCIVYTKTNIVYWNSTFVAARMTVSRSISWKFPDYFVLRYLCCNVFKGFIQFGWCYAWQGKVFFCKKIYTVLNLIVFNLFFIGDWNTEYAACTGIQNFFFSKEEERFLYLSCWYNLHSLGLFRLRSLTFRQTGCV